MERTFGMLMGLMFLAGCATALIAAPVQAAESEVDLAKKTQNPLANLISEKQ